MKLPSGPWDGAQPRSHVLAVLHAHGVKIAKCDDDFYELCDPKDEVVNVVYLPNPVLREMVVWLFRNYGHCGFAITDLAVPRQKHN